MPHGGAPQPQRWPSRADAVDIRVDSASRAPRRREGSAARGARRVICLQVGARENYAVARAFHRRGALAALVTDLWVGRQASTGVIPQGSLRSFADRAHTDLAEAPVISANVAALSREAWSRLRGLSSWERVIARNRWFQRMAVDRLERLGVADGAATVFAYSYAARDVFRYASARGWRTVLGQIDPGLVEERIVAAECRRVPDLASKWTPAPGSYWAAWREELALADRIVVNSGWSHGALTAEGVAAERLDLIPLGYEPPPEAGRFRRRYPARFDGSRPLRALFLGQVNLRKGVAALLEAARLLRDAPVEFHFVGPVQIVRPEGLARGARVVWHGPVPRSEVHSHYRNADVFLLPTLSDGFGLTQLEARAWRLPLIVTHRCGAVVEDGLSGLLVPPGDPEALAEAIRRCLDDPGWLQSAADTVAPGERYGIDDLADSLMAIA